MTFLEFLHAVIPGIMVAIVLVILKPYFTSYAGEKGKNLATREDIDKILTQTETIKAQISGDLWDRQMKWNLKRDLYVRLLENLADMGKAVDDYESVMLMVYHPEEDAQGKPAPQPSPEDWKQFREECRAARQQVERIADELRRATTVSAIVLNDIALQALHEYELAMKKAHIEYDIEFYERMERRQAAVEKAITQVRDAAK